MQKLIDVVDFFCGFTYNVYMNTIYKLYEEISI